jgi:hypothetical protein
MGFLTLGNRFMNNQQDIIDDRIDVVTRGLLGLTVTCARCHDHKFDPIPTADYYSLYGVFASSVEPRALPVIAPPERTAAYLAYEKELQRREKKLSDFLDRKHAELTAEWRAHVTDYLMAVYEERRQPSTEQFMFVIQPGQRHPMIVQRWRAFLADRRHGHDAVFAPWFAFAELPEKEFAARAPAVASRWAGNADAAHRINPLVAALFAGKPPASMEEVARRYAQLFAGTDRLWQDARKHGAAALADADREQVRQVQYGPRAAPDVPRRDIARFILDRASRGQLQQMRKDIEHYVGTSKAAPPRAMVLRDAPTPYEPHVFLRGNPSRWGPAVPRQFVEVVAGAQRRPFTHGSGRLDLARAIADRDNPLTARVLVNRVWLHHFGQGLVRTPSDFGTRSDPPTHPELLDYLASYFMDHGWSLKNLHRLIVLSATYGQTSIADSSSIRNPQSAIRNRSNPQSIDLENRLLWRMNRQRLDFEALRDSLLAVAGRLDRPMGGPSVDLTARPFSGRRTVYGFIDRSNMPGVFRTFDLPNPDATSPQRYQTTVPLQALFLMNSPFVVEQARHLTRRAEVVAARQDEAKVVALYRLVYGRLPDAEEVALGRRFVRQQAAAPSARSLGPWEAYAQVLLLSNEFAFVD